ncbi:MAG TPA: DUF3467 domain-containing protein [Chloroflexi bacterium]|nr:DUF3467 domain-containing protein [Chloroflexota bacterium]HBY08573.1 DUF3467 domain-containing protein [Chloroflexota bacterium]
MTQATPPSPKPIPQMEIPEDLEPSYVNVVRITHSPSEMIFDFARILPGMAASKVVSRILMSPLSAKLFHRALSENLAKYEASFGEIKMPGDSSSLAEHLFRPPQK